MANTILDIFYSLSSCICCFPSTPQLKINNRSFRMLRLLGEVSALRAYQSKEFCTLTVCEGWLLLCIPCTGHQRQCALRTQENPLSFRPRVRLTGTQGSRSIY